MQPLPLPPRRRRLPAHPLLLAVFAGLLLTACPSTSDVRSRDDIGTLKTTHLGFIDEFTEGTGKTWDDQKLTSRAAAVELEFTNAEQYESTKKKDARRAKSISILHSQFKRHVAMLERRKAFFRPKFAADLKDQVTQNYDQALRGEDLR
jgi:hypothetical protein